MIKRGKCSLAERRQFIGHWSMSLTGSRWKLKDRKFRKGEGVSQNKNEKKTSCERANGGAGYRSPCLSHAKRALYHLSYTPKDEITTAIGSNIICHIGVGRAQKAFVRKIMEIELCDVGAKKTGSGDNIASPLGQHFWDVMKVCQICWQVSHM